MGSKLCTSSGCRNITKIENNFCGPCIMTKHRYGMTIPERDFMLLSQGGKCLICGTEVFFTGKSGSRVDTANIDHCHKRNIVRGILCWPCNTAIGKLGEDVERIRKAADYVERYV